MRTRYKKRFFQDTPIYRGRWKHMKLPGASVGGSGCPPAHPGGGRGVEILPASCRLRAVETRGIWCGEFGRNYLGCIREFGSNYSG
nr:MAG TPA: hypothetical protein [Caudoviricetes sp.]